MFSKTWRIVLLLIILIAMLWPNLIGNAIFWVALIAVVLLIIGELFYKAHEKHPHKKTHVIRDSHKSKKKKRR